MRSASAAEHYGAAEPGTIGKGDEGLWDFITENCDEGLRDFITENSDKGLREFTTENCDKGLRENDGWLSPDS